MLRTILIGHAPPKREHTGGGIAKFIQFELRYESLVYRLLIVAVASLVFWALAWLTVAKLGLLVVEVYASLLAIRFVADASQRWEISRILTAMWLPLGVSAVAAYLLFLNDQGRELGVGLMDSNAKGLYLGLILIYWAFNNWLSARLGLDRVFSQPRTEQALLFWGPRLVGVLAHLLAAFSLMSAAWIQPDLHGTSARWLAFSAPAAIFLATVFVWLLDYGYVSRRSNNNRRPAARKWMLLVAGVELILFVGLVYAWLYNEVPPGFFLATLSISVSAIIFLGLISILRRDAPVGPDALSEDRERTNQFEQMFTTYCTIILAVFTLIGAILIWGWPMQIGHFLGSLSVACFSFGAFLAVVNLLHLWARGLARYASLAGFSVSPRVLAAVFLCFLVLPALLTSLTRSFHLVRLCEDNDKTCTRAATPLIKAWTAVEDPDKRPSVSEAARGWYAQAEPAYHAVHPGKPVPMFIVATAGGGIRAAYWTATILERLEQDLGPKNLMHHLLFAISGVSGGSVGAAAYAAAVHNHEVNNDAAIAPTSYLGEDFLAPGLASMVFIDAPANVLPDFGQMDRGQALELGFEHASRTNDDPAGLVSHKFLSFFPTMDTVKQTSSWRPALLLNATHQETGRRIITSHIKIERDAFLDSYDALQVLGSDVRLSTAAHNSARFTYISPAGDLVGPAKPNENQGYVIDGGYFENYGAETALELARTAIDAIDPEHKNLVKLVVLQISSDPTLQQDRTLVRTLPQGDGTCVVTSFGTPGEDNYLNLRNDEGENGLVLSGVNELSAPLVGIMSVRQAHGTIAAEGLAASICGGKGKVVQALNNQLQQKTSVPLAASTAAVANNGTDAPHFSHLAMCEQSDNGGPGIVPPLGWVLSDHTRSRFKDILNDCHNGEELKSLEEALDRP
jgi:succinate dehydrogenase hydrophobic anchor subunit